MKWLWLTAFNAMWVTILTGLVAAQSGGVQDGVKLGKVYVTGGGRNPFGVTSLFIPSKSAEVVMNGKKAAGNVYRQKRGPAQSSTAFLAFSESWIK